MIHAQIDIDKLMTGDEWETTVGELLRDELRLAIKAEIKKGVKEDKQLKKVVDAYKRKALDEALKATGLS